MASSAVVEAYVTAAAWEVAPRTQNTDCPVSVMRERSVQLDTHLL